MQKNFASGWIISRGSPIPDLDDLDKDLGHFELIIFR